MRSGPRTTASRRFASTSLSLVLLLGPRAVAGLEQVGVGRRELGPQLVALGLQLRLLEADDFLTRFDDLPLADGHRRHAAADLGADPDFLNLDRTGQAQEVVGA